MIDVWMVNVSAAVTLLATGWRTWLIAKDEHLFWVYWLMIITAISNGTVNIVIVNEQPQYWGIWSFNILNVWGIVMAIKGLMRLRREKQW